MANKMLNRLNEFKKEVGEKWQSRYLVYKKNQSAGLGGLEDNHWAEYFGMLSKHERERAHLYIQEGLFSWPLTIMVHESGCRYEDDGPYAVTLSMGCPDCDRR